MMNIEHGEVIITTHNNIIIVKLIGGFNEFGAKKYTNGVKELVANFNGENFSILINNLEMEGGTPEAYDELEQYNKWLNTQKLTAKAMVISSIAAAHIIDHLSPSRKLQRCKSFDNEADAMHWLENFS